MRRALITGITGQDGSYLAEFLLNKNYEVHGIYRRHSLIKLDRIQHLTFDSHCKDKKSVVLHYGDLTDSSSILRILQKVQPDEIYNLAAQSHVRISFDTPEYTANADGLGTLRILEAMRVLGLEKKTKFYQASTSEMFGKVTKLPLSEKEPFYPRSPYGAAKLYAHWVTVNYREAYNIFACSGILFNHESPRRGDNFVTKKITKIVAQIKYGFKKCLYLGNLYAKRDWGYAKEYVEVMWLMLQQPQPKDYVIATGEAHSVKEFVELAFKKANIEIEWEGEGIQERAINKKDGSVVVAIDPYYFRPTEVDILIGDPSLAKKELKWSARITFEELVNIMMEHDLQYYKKLKYGKN